MKQYFLLLEVILQSPNFQNLYFGQNLPKIFFFSKIVFTSQENIHFSVLKRIVFLKNTIFSPKFDRPAMTYLPVRVTDQPR